MTTLFRTLAIVARYALYVLGLVVLIALLTVLFVGLTTPGARFAADRVSALVSKPGQQVAIETPGGLLSGRLRVPRITLSDDQGVYGDITGLAVDWRPLQLLKGRFDASLVHADAVRLTRLPPPAPASEPSAGGLPVALDIDRFEVADLALGRAVAGRDLDLTLSGTLKADATDAELTLDAARRDLPDARLTAALAYVPAENRLRLDGHLVEPKDGILATLLQIPDAPALSIAATGEGPLSDWSGTISAKADAVETVRLAARHQLADNGDRAVSLSGGGDVARFMPPFLRPLFAGETRVDLAALLGPSGKLRIEKGTLASAGLSVAAEGTYDPVGDNDLTASLTTGKTPAEMSLAVGDRDLTLSLKSAKVTLSGPAARAALGADLVLGHLAFARTTFDDLTISADSTALDLGTQSGPLALALSAARIESADPALDRLLDGPLDLKGGIVLSADTIDLGETTLESPRLGGRLSGRYDRTSQDLQALFKLFAVPAVLPEALAGRFDGTIGLSGDLRRDAAGVVSIGDLALTSSTLTGAGSLLFTPTDGAEQLALKLDGTLPDLQRLTPQAAGAARYKLTTSGLLSALDITLGLSADTAELAGRTLTGLKLDAEGSLDPAAPQARITATGALDRQNIDIAADLASEGGRTRLSGLDITVGSNRITGALDLSAGMKPDGTLTFDLPDAGLLAALAGQRLEGDLRGTAVFSSAGAAIATRLKAEGRALRRDTLSIEAPRIDLAVSDLLHLAASGSLEARRIAIGANRIDDLSLAIERKGSATGFTLAAAYDGKPLKAEGAVTTDGGPALRLDSFSAAPRGLALSLAAPTTLRSAAGGVRLDGLAISAGKGRVTIDGTAGSTLDLDLRLSGLPLGLADAFSPDLGADGTLSGTIAVEGPASDPRARYDVTIDRLAVAQTRAAALPPLDLAAKGQFENGRAGLTLTLSGGGLTLGGTGSVGVIGSKALDLELDGTLPFSLASSFLTPQGFSLTGSAAVNIAIGGNTEAPTISGRISTSGAKLVDVRRNLALNDLAASITLTGDSAQIESLSAKLSGGGSLSGSGTIGLQPGSNFPADLTITLVRAAYVDGTLFQTTADGTLTLKGPLLAGPTLGGAIALGRTDITIPEKMPASLSEVNVKHKNAPAAVREQNREIRKNEGGGDGGSGRGLALDLTVSAPAQIFVRGRGIDAELGGTLTVRGTTAEPQVSGGFEMRRGRFIILNRRLDFTDGSITFGGDLTPALDLAASTTSGSTTVTVTVTGLANDPTIAFSSTPALPQDEILAQLIFGQSLSRLSALQIAQLADAATQLAGGRSTSLFQSLRSGLGVDDLDVSTDEEGQTNVRAGKYLNKNTYIQLEQGTGSGAKATINLDIGRGVKLKGSAGSDGGAAGIFYEKEY